MNDTKQHYETMISLTATPEWKQFLEIEVQPAIAMLKDSLMSSDSEKDVFRVQGQIRMLMWLSSLEDAARNQLAALDEVET